MKTNLACTRQGFPLVIIPSGNSAVDNITMGTNLFLLFKAQVITNPTISLLEQSIDYELSLSS